MTMPEVWCEIAFVKDSTDGSPLWRDVSDDVEWQEGVRISRRRSHELDEIQPGTLALTLNNDDGRYTAGNSSSPYYPNVKINRPIRVRARWPIGSVNMLLEGQAKGSDAALFAGSFGTTTVDGTIVPAGQTTAIKWTGFSTGNLFRLGAKTTITASDQALPVVAGSTYSVRCQARRDTNGVSVRARIRFYDEAGAVVSETNGSTVALTTSFQAVSVSATAPAGALFVRVVLEVTIAAASAIVYSSAWQFEEAASPTTWVSPGAEYIQYQGFTDKWPHIWEQGVLGKAQLTATDRMKLLSRQRVSREALVEETLGTFPFFYYPLAEAEGSTAAGNQATIAQPDLATTQVGSGGLLTFGTSLGPLGSSMVHLDPTDGTNGKCLATTSIAGMGGAAAITLAAWVVLDASSPGYQDAPIFYLADAGGSDSKINIQYLYNTDEINFFCKSLGTGSGGNYSINLRDGIPHHIAFVCEFSGGVCQQRVWLDGVQVVNTSTGISGSTWQPLTQLRVGAAPPSVIGSGFNMWSGYVGQMAGWNRALSGTEIGNLYNAGGASTELSGTRITRVLDWAGVTVTATDAGVSLLDISAYGTSSNSLQDIREAAFSDGGVFFIARDGISTFHDRARRQDPASAPLITITADQCGPDLSFVIDDTLLFNDVTVSRKNVATRVTDTTSIDDYGQYTASIQTVLASDSDAIQRGQLMLGRYSQPSPRAGQVTLEVRSMPSLWPSILACDIGHRLSITDLPAASPSSSIQLWVEGAQHVITDQTWFTALDTSPSSSSAFILDDPVYGLLDNNALGW